jgi:hypothetical protein
MSRLAAPLLAVVCLGVAAGAPRLKDPAPGPLFFPVAEGATWVYQIGGSEVTYAVTAVERRADGTVVRVSRVPPGGESGPADGHARQREGGVPSG